MTTDDALRRDLIKASRSRAIDDRNRLSRRYPLTAPLALAAAGLMLAWAAFGPRRRLAVASLAVGGCAWLAWHGSQSRPTSVDENDCGDASAPQVLLVDEASCQSFPASDPPGENRFFRG